MSFNIDSFTSQHFDRDFYRPNLFFVDVTGSPAGEFSDFRFMVKAANIPASTVESLEVPFLNRIIKVAGDRTFEDWSVTVMNDEGFQYRQDLEAWSNFINSPEANESTTPTEYKGEIKVTPMGRDGTELREYTFHGAYPTSIEAIDLAWESGAAPSEYGVTFAFDYWTAD